MIKVLISHPQTLFLQGLDGVLKGHDGLKVAFCANEVSKVLEYLRKSQVDVVITNVEMSGSNGISILKDINKRKMRCRTILLANHLNPLLEQVARKEGASALLESSCTLDDLVDMIYKVMEEGSKDKFFCQTNFESFGRLSKREVEVYLLLVSGMSVKEVSLELDINEKTASTYKRRLFIKLNVNSIVELLLLHSTIS